MGNALRVFGASLVGIGCLVGAALLLNKTTSAVQETAVGCLAIVGVLWLVLAAVYELIGAVESARKESEKTTAAVNGMDATLNRVRLLLAGRE